MIGWQQRTKFYSLGIAVQNQDVYAVLLMWQSKQWQLVDNWHWCNKPAAPTTTATQPDTLISAVDWQDFLHFLYQRLSAFGQVPKLTITIGIHHQACAWLPLCQGDQVEWQRQAAAHWQIPANQVFLDVLPINTTFSLLACIPKEPIQELIKGLSILTPLSRSVPQIALDTDLTCLYRLWSIHQRDHIALLLTSPLTSGVSLPNVCKWHYCQSDGVHTCTTEGLPKLITDLFITTDPNTHNFDSNSALLTIQPSVKKWLWRQANLPSTHCIAWHLALQPTVSRFICKTPWQRQGPTHLPGWQLL